MSSRGQIVIPAEARNNLNIKEGDILSCYVEEGKIIIKNVRLGITTTLCLVYHLYYY